MRLLESFLGRVRGVRLGSGALAQHRCLVAGERRAFVELRLDLPIELPDGPAASKRLGLVEGSRVQVVDRQTRLGLDRGTLVVFDRRQAAPPIDARTCFEAARTPKGRAIKDLGA